jgi:hypothetical protein
MPSGIWRGPAQASNLAEWRPPTIACQVCSPHATSTHKKTKQYEFLKLFLFSLPKAAHFLSFLGTFTKISLTSSALKEWQGSVGWLSRLVFGEPMQSFLIWHGAVGHQKNHTQGVAVQRALGMHPWRCSNTIK